jgi:hypothetical protein
MKTIICHPDNVEIIRKAVSEGPGYLMAMMGFQIVASPYVERTKPTGKYRLQDGRVVDKDKIRIRERFVEYGPEDFDWLLGFGFIQEQHDLVWYLMDDRFAVDAKMNCGIYAYPYKDRGKDAPVVLAPWVIGDSSGV